MLKEKEYNISDFITDLLKDRFSDNLIKQEVDSSDPKKLNFACPYCGDSTKDSNKKRGNFYHKSGTYKCFNDGCLVYVKTKQFITDFADKHHLSIPSISDSNIPVLSGVESKRGYMIEFMLNPKVNVKMLKIKDIAERFSLKPCSEARSDSKVGKYIRNRFINELPTFNDTCYFDSNDSKIFIFNLDKRSGKILGLATRKIDDEAPGPRYDIKNYSEFVDKKLANDLSEDEIFKFDNINNFFNILNVRFNKPIIITEGQFDSMFLDNAIATTGVTKSKSLLGSLLSKKNAFIFFDNDMAGKTESIKLLQQGYNVFLWSKFIEDLRKKYPDNRKEINEVGDINKLYQFYVERGDRMSVEEFDIMLRSYFSNSIYDLLEV